MKFNMLFWFVDRVHAPFLFVGFMFVITGRPCRNEAGGLGAIWVCSRVVSSWMRARVVHDSGSVQVSRGFCVVSTQVTGYHVPQRGSTFFMPKRDELTLDL